jgi:hypothetical protein
MNVLYCRERKSKITWGATQGMLNSDPIQDGKKEKELYNQLIRGTGTPAEEREEEREATREQ